MQVEQAQVGYVALKPGGLQVVEFCPDRLIIFWGGLSMRQNNMSFPFEHISGLEIEEPSKWRMRMGSIWVHTFGRQKSESNHIGFQINEGEDLKRMRFLIDIMIDAARSGRGSFGKLYPASLEVITMLMEWGIITREQWSVIVDDVEKEYAQREPVAYKIHMERLERRVYGS